MKSIPSAVWLVVGRITSDALSFVLFIIIAREFGPSGIGVYSFNFAVATILYEFVTLGIEEYGVREYARRPPEHRAYLVSGLLGAQLAITFVALAIVASLLFTSALDSSHIPLLSFMIIYQVACAIARTLFIPPFVSGKVAVQVVGEMLSRAGILLLAVVLMALSAPSLTESLIGFPIFGISLMILAAVMAARLGSSIIPRISREATSEVLSALWSFAAANLLTGLYTRTGILLLFLMVGSTQAGIFASGFKFAEVAWIVLAMVPWSAYAKLSRLYHSEPAEFRSLSLDVLRATLVFGGVIAWGMFWVLPQIVELLLGSKFAGTEPVLQGMAAWVLVLSVNVFLSRLMLVAEQQLARFRVTFVQTALNLALNLALIPVMGIQGAVIGFVVAQGVAVILELYVLRAHTDMRSILRILGIFLLAVAGAAVAGELTALYATQIWIAPAASLAGLLLVAWIGGLFDFARRALGLK